MSRLENKEFAHCKPLTVREGGIQFLPPRGEDPASDDLD